jgi:hypothetical protein
MTARMGSTLLKLAGEYIIITLPILIYICLEAIRRDDAAFLYRSPEWSIATIFLIIQTIRMYLEAMHGSVGRAFSYLLVLVLTVATLAAGVNIYVALDDVKKQTTLTVAVKWSLFCAASSLFVIIAGAAIYDGERDGVEGVELG